MKSVLSVIQELRSNNSRLFKEEVLKREEGNVLLKQVAYLTLDSSTQFYIRKIPSYEFQKETFTLQDALDQLSMLSERKVTGKKGIAHLKNILENVAPDDAKVIEMVIASDLDCGVSTSTVNKIWPGLVPEYPYMRCSQFKEIKKANINWPQGVYSQIKSDGIFASITHTKNGTVIIATRSGNFFDNSQFSDIVSEIKTRTQPGWQFHGELLVEEDGTVLARETGNGVLNSVLKDGKFGLSEVPVFVCWDAVPLEKATIDGTYEVEYKTRLGNVCELFRETTYIKPTETRAVYSLDEAMEHYSELVDEGHEGSIIKCQDAFWEDGTSKKQFKVKVEFTCDLKIVALNPGNGKNEKTFGSVKCVSSDGLLEVNVSGMKDNVREMIWSQKDSIIGKIMEVKANSIMKPKKEGGKYSLFLPRFVEIREDKTNADNLQRIYDQFDSVVKRVK